MPVATKNFLRGVRGNAAELKGVLAQSSNACKRNEGFVEEDVEGFK
jgi:hypothetical protein